MGKPASRSETETPWEERSAVNCVLVVPKLNPSCRSPLSVISYNPLCQAHFIPSSVPTLGHSGFSRLAGSDEDSYQGFLHDMVAEFRASQRALSNLSHQPVGCPHLSVSNPEVGWGEAD